MCENILYRTFALACQSIQTRQDCQYAAHFTISLCAFYMLDCRWVRSQISRPLIRVRILPGLTQFAMSLCAFLFSQFHSEWYDNKFDAIYRLTKHLTLQFLNRTNYFFSRFQSHFFHFFKYGGCNPICQPGYFLSQQSCSRMGRQTDNFAAAIERTTNRQRRCGAEFSNAEEDSQVELLISCDEMGLPKSFYKKSCGIWVCRGVWFAAVSGRLINWFAALHFFPAVWHCSDRLVVW